MQIHTKQITADGLISFDSLREWRNIHLFGIMLSIIFMIGAIASFITVFLIFQKVG